MKVSMALVLLIPMVLMGQVALNVDFETGFPAGWQVYIMGDTSISYGDPAGWHIKRATYWYWPPDEIGDSAIWHGDVNITEDDNGDGETLCDDWLVSPQVTIPDGAIFTYWRDNAYMSWYHHHGVYISTGSGDPADGEFVLIFEDSSDVDWEPCTLDISPYYGQTVYIAWRYMGDYATEWGIDNIFLGVPITVDVAANEILGIPGMMVKDTTVVPKLVIENLFDIDTAGVCTMEIPGFDYHHEVEVDLPANAVDTVEFPPLEVDPIGSFTAIAYVTFGDPVPDNDTVRYDFYVLEEYGPDFEVENGGFIASVEPGAPEPGWEYGEVGPYSGPNTYPEPHSGTRYWGTRLYEDYANNAMWYLDRLFITATKDTPVVAFWHWYYMEGYDWGAFDGGNVKLSTDGGATWELIYPIGGYPYDDIDALGEPGYSGISGGGDTSIWVPAVFELPMIDSGETFGIRLTFGSDASVGYPGWYIDDIMTTGVVGEIPFDLSVMEFAGIPDGASLSRGVAQHIGVVIRNPTIGGPIDLRVHVRITRATDGAIVWSEFKDVFGFTPGVDTIWLGDWVPFDPGTYTLNVAVNAVADPVLYNNTMTINVTVGAKLGEQEVTRFFLHGPTPNPAAGTSVIEFGLPKATRVEFRLVDIAGRTVREVNETMASGVHTITLDNIATGVYFYHFSAGSEARYGKLVIVQ